MMLPESTIIPGVVTIGAIILIAIGGLVMCSNQGPPVRLPEKKVSLKEAAPVAPASFQKWLNHFSWDGKWACRKTTEEEPAGHYCSIQSTYNGALTTLYCNSESCDVVTLVHEAKWSKSIPNPGFAAPIFSEE